jgi:hypothetical protein
VSRVENNEVALMAPQLACPMNWRRLRGGSGGVEDMGLFQDGEIR